MSIEQVIIIVTTAIAVITAGVSLAKVRSERRKISAEAKKLDVDTVAVISSSALALLAPMEKEMTNLRKRASDAEAAVEAVTRRARQAEAKLTTNELQLADALRRIEELETTVGELTARLARYEDEGGS